MTTYSWTGTASTDFANAANWIVAATGVPNGGAPGAQDSVELAGAGVITGAGTVAALDVLDSTGGGYTLSAAIAASSVSVLGDLNLAFGGQLSAASVAVGGAPTFGFLQISAGTLAAIGGALALVVSDGQGASAPAQLTAGTGTQGGNAVIALGGGAAQIGLGAGGDGAVSLANGTITGGSGSRIIVGQDDAAGTLTLLAASAAISTHGALTLGDSGFGEASLLQGGSLTVGNGSGAVLVLGAQDGTQTTQALGVLLATGASITAYGQMQVGEAGQGTATLTGGSLSTFGGVVLGDGRFAQGTLSLAGGTWTDTGAVTVGNSGSGTVQISAGNGQVGHAFVHGALLVGASTGTGALSVLAGSTLTVKGETVLGAAALDTITVSGGATLNAATHLVQLNGALPGAQGSTLSVDGAGSALEAGFLSVGKGDVVQALSGGALLVGASAAGTAGSVSGALIVDTGSTLTASGNVAVAGGAGAHGLLLLGGDAAFTATAGPALTLVAGGLVSVQGSSATLTATGGMLAAAQSTVVVTGGYVSASATTGLALQLSNGGSLQMDGGTLSTIGGFSIDDGRGRPGAEGGTLSVNGGTLSSARGVTGRPAVFIGSQGGATSVAELQGANWTVTGGVEVGVTGSGELLLQHSDLLVSRALLVGGAGHGIVTADTVVSGGTLTAFETGVSAATIAVAGSGSMLETGTLRVGGSAASSSLSLAAGTLSVAGGATVTGGLAMAAGTLTAGTVTVAAGGVIAGTGFLQAGSILDQGRIGALGGTLSLLGTINGTGSLGVRAGTLILTQAEALNVAFGNAGTIVTPSIADLAGIISGWQPHDAIDFTGVRIASFTLSGSTLSLFDNASHLLGTETFAGSVASSDFTLASDNGTGTLLGYHG